MKTKQTDIILQNKIFLWLAVATGMVLMVPVIGMQVSTEWNWTLSDFIIIGTLLFGMGSLFIVTARNMKSGSKRMLVGGIFLLAVLYIWAELAVGIFTNLGN